MKPGRAPNYRLTEEHNGLPAGAYVRPIELHYVPKDTLERLGKFIDPNTQVVCYTAIGMIIVPRAKLKEGQ